LLENPIFFLAGSQLLTLIIFSMFKEKYFYMNFMKAHGK